MTTLTIEISDSEKAVIADFIMKRGGNILSVDDENDLTKTEFELLQESYKEALLIRQGKINGLPASELWND